MLKFEAYLALPANTSPGGFDHAAIHQAARRLYVAHTSNNAVDVIDCQSDRYLHSIPGLVGVAGALVSDERDLVFTSNRGEDTISIFSPENETGAVRVGVGSHPNGLSFDPERGILLVANVGDPAIPDSFTLSIVSVTRHKMIASIPVPARTRWTVYDPPAEVFFVNIAKPPLIGVVDGKDPTRIAYTLDIPADGPHGLDLGRNGRSLFCACDDKQLVTLDLGSGKVQSQTSLSGIPDVIFFNPGLEHLYVAIGDPCLIEVFDTHTMQRIESVPTEGGAHTLAFDPVGNKIYAFLPQTNRAAVYRDK